MSLTIAIPKGKLGSQAVEMFKAIGMGETIDENSRKLIFKDENSNISFIMLKNSDVLTYVENGIADIGVLGKDMIMEEGADIYELYKMNIGKCKMSIAGIKDKEPFNGDANVKVTTKFPKLAERLFKSKGKIIKLNGSIELAPILGLSDVIFDIVETGATLKENGLEVYEDMFDISAVLISNKVSYKFKREKIKKIIKLLREEDCNGKNN